MSVIHCAIAKTEVCVFRRQTISLAAKRRLLAAFSQPPSSPTGLALSPSLTSELNGRQITQLFLLAFHARLKAPIIGGTETIGTYYMCDLLKPFTVMDLRWEFTGINFYLKSGHLLARMWCIHFIKREEKLRGRKRERKSFSWLEEMGSI